MRIATSGGAAEVFEKHSDEFAADRFAGSRRIEGGRHGPGVSDQGNDRRDGNTGEVIGMR